MGPLEALVGHLPARVTMVVGKGGVGKTTTAGALALALAERSGGGVHLVSTDPAHSLGHLFAQDLSSGAATSRCHAGLTLEELDAAARGRAWFQEAGSAVADLIERGTYLDEEDVLGLLTSSLPGMDEIMAAFRLVELEGAPGPGRIVVDTAPTGHLLRLLDSAEILDGWSEALAAMAEKAGVVASRLTGRRVRFAGEAVLNDLQRTVTAFRQDVVGAADFVVVTRAGAVVGAETERLVGELRRRELDVAAVVAGEPARESVPDRADDVPLVRVAWGLEPADCDGLRGWGRGPARASPGRRRKLAAAAGSANPSALERPILLFCGKGGVGKSTCAAAWAVHRAARRPTLLLSTDPAGSLADVLGAEAEAVSARVPGLTIRQVEAEKDFGRFKDEYRARIEDVFLRLGMERSNSLDRRVLASLLQMAPPGLDEIFALDALLDALGEERDVILDSAPTGHFLRLMEMPELALGWTRAVIRALLKYRVALGLDDVAERLLRFARRLRELMARLHDPASTGVVVVTTGGALAVAETQRLLSRLDESGLPVAALIHNRYSPRLAREAAGSRGSTLPIFAPRLDVPPVGVDALRSFVSRWEWA